MKNKLTAALIAILMVPALVFSQTLNSSLENVSQLSGMAATVHDLNSSKLFAAKAFEDPALSIASPVTTNAALKNSSPLKRPGVTLAPATKKHSKIESRPSPIWEMLTDGPARGFYGILGMALLIVGITALFSTGAGISLLGVGVFFAAVITFHLVADYINKEHEFAYRKKS